MTRILRRVAGGTWDWPFDWRCLGELAECDCQTCARQKWQVYECAGDHLCPVCRDMADVMREGRERWHDLLLRRDE